MFPILFNIGFLEIHTYGLFIAIAFVLASTLLIKKAGKFGIDKKIAENFVFGVLISAIIGARLFYVLINLTYYLNAPMEILKIWQGGLVYWGGFIGGVSYTIFYCKKYKLKIWEIADISVPYLALAHAIGRLGCFSAGCCYGRKTDSFLGVIFTSSDTLAPIGEKLHPTQLYEFAGDLFIFAILLKILNARKFRGQVIGLYLILYPILRFIVEFFRNDERGAIGIFTATQAVSLAAFAVGIMVIWINKNNAKNK